MSRIIVKNLPQSGVPESELKKHFSDIGQITDIKLKFNNAGTFRRFAFVGFKEEDAATKACENLQNSFIKTSKILIENCKAIREVKQPRAKEDSEVKIANKEKRKHDPFEEVRDDPEFNEFISLQRNIGENTNSKQVWADDVNMGASLIEQRAPKDNTEVDDQPKKKRHHRSRPKKKSNKSKPKEIFVHTLKASGFPAEVRRKDIIDFFKPTKLLSVRLNKRDGVCYASFKDDSDMKFALRKNNHFWTTFRIKLWRHDVKRSKLFKEKLKEKLDEKELVMKKQQEKLERAEPIEESGRLFVRNLNYSCAQDDLEQVFSRYGELTEVHFPIDKKTSLPKGYAYVEFMFPENAKKAYEELNGTIFQGRNFHLLPSEPKPEPRLNDYEQQAKQMSNRVEESSQQQEQTSNATAKPESKLEPPRLLPLPKSNPAEPATPSVEIKATTDQTPTSIPDISAVERPSAYKSERLRQQRENAPRASNWNILFLGQNALADVVSDARGVDKRELLTKQTRKEPIAVRMALGDATVVEEMRNFLISHGIELDSFDNTRAPRSRTVILVKNLPKSTERDDIQRLFEAHGRVSRVIMPPNGLTAIVEMEEAVEAKLAFRKLAYMKFKDSVLYLEWAPINVFREKSLEDQDQDEMEQLLKAQTGTKILVKNVPFEATQQELKKIFATYGELNFVRIPKKIDGSHRGFGFVDYLTREDALRAFRSLSHSTHLYGRRLVLEWAKSDEQRQ